MLACMGKALGCKKQSADSCEWGKMSTAFRRISPLRNSEAPRDIFVILSFIDAGEMGMILAHKRCFTLRAYFYECVAHDA